ncbi:MAG TPA: PEP-CTERM sorting domain-containing protein [Tepidisphaeraceae bacterium]
MNTTYNLYVYTSAVPGAVSANRTTHWDVTGSTVATGTTVSSTTFWVQHSSYEAFSLQPQGDGTMVIGFKGDSSTGNEGDFAAFQITPASIPEPSALGVLAIAVAALLRRRRA